MGRNRARAAYRRHSVKAQSAGGRKAEGDGEDGGAVAKGPHLADLPRRSERGDSEPAPEQVPKVSGLRPAVGSDLPLTPSLSYQPCALVLVVPGLVLGRLRSGIILGAIPLLLKLLWLYF